MNKITKKKLMTILSIALILCFVFAVSAFATGETTSTDDATTNSSSGIIQTVIMLALLLVIFYFFLIRPEKKRKKKEQELRASLGVGDDIVTIGGICGKIVTVTNDNITIETSEDRVRVELAKWAISRKAK